MMKNYETDENFVLNFTESSNENLFFDDLSDTTEIHDIDAQNECLSGNKNAVLNKDKTECVLKKIKRKNFMKNIITNLKKKIVNFI